MSRSLEDQLALKAELTDDPLDLGLTILAADDEANSVALNLVREICAIDRTAVPVSDIAKAIDRDEFAALSASDRQWLALVTSGGAVNPQAGSEVREGMLQLFGIGTETRTNLTALLTEPASRIEQLFKAGTLQAGGVVTPSDIADARNVT